MTPAKPNFLKSLDELRRLLNAAHVPPGIKDACLCLSEKQTKLFCFVGYPSGAFGTPNLLPGLHASNFLNELIEAMRALQLPTPL
jgi:hypothetical protein